MRRLRWAPHFLLFLLWASVGCGSARAAQPAWLELYGGYLTPSGGLIFGRAHRGTRPADPKPGEPEYRRIHETLQALEPHVLGGAQVLVRLGDGDELPVRSNERGYLDLILRAAQAQGLAGPVPVRIRARLAEPRYAAAPAEATVPFFADQPGLAVISDVDDTILDTQVTHKLRMVRNTLIRSSFELRAFPGVVEALTRAARGRPLAYISGSPWGLHGRIADYFRRAGLPDGVLLLKHFSSEPLTDQMAFKWPHITALVDALPARRFLLFGDSGEKDPEIYARLRAERPRSVEAIYIHLVTDEDPAAPRFRGMTVFRQWSEIGARLP